MDRKEIKELAKSKIKGNLWDILWPLIVILVLESVVSRIFGVETINININDLSTLTDLNVSPSYYLGNGLVAIIFGVINAGYLKYILNFVRTSKFEVNDIIDTIKEKWVNILISVILVSVIVAFASLLLVVPGIILGLAYSFAVYLVIDTDVAGNDSLKMSREMMKGYKWDYFVFNLSFLGWVLLSPFTLFLLFIWLGPYITVANAIYYDKLKKMTSKKK